MALTPGTRIDVYEIAGTLGAGGMGEVYRARDTNLKRAVAIKVLPDAFAADAERLARFQREAEVLASLNHPHIAAIYGLEKSAATTALVMELVEGPTLADRIAHGPIPIDEALPIARQIADALDAAHEQGIIHRDLKPANIKVRDDGTVKVLDFGLAKAFTPDSDGRSPVALANSPTLTSPLPVTGVGTILGTAAYMAPEQAKGRRADTRSDIWAFGCVFYEMLTGRAAFQGEDTTEILAAVVRGEPDWNRLPAATPPAIRTLLRRCLQKDPRRRWQSAADLRIEIEEAVNASPAGADATDQRLTLSWGWMSVAVLVLILAGGITAWIIKPGEQVPAVTRSLVGVTPADRLAGNLVVRTAIVLSPDGHSLVFVGQLGNTRRLYRRRMDTLDATVIPGTEDADGPFFSPDGQWVGFWQGPSGFGATGELKKVPLGGGPAVSLCKTPRPWGVSWGSHGKIVFADGIGSELWHVGDTGGTPEQLTTIDAAQGEAAHRLPHVLPGGEAILFTVHKALRSWDDTRIVVQSLATGARKTLVEGGTDARYISSGHVVYIRSGTVMAVPFDGSRLEVTGRSVALVDEVMQDVVSSFAVGNSGAAQFSVSASGTLAYVSGGISSAVIERDPIWINRRGAVEEFPASLPSPGATMGRLSPDGQKVMFVANDLLVYHIERGVLSPLRSDVRAAVWHPDGTRITFASGAGGPTNLFSIVADGSSPPERLTTNNRNQFPTSWSPGGKALAFTQIAEGVNLDIWVLSMRDGLPTAHAFLATPFIEQWPEFSPDGRWLAYGSNESGRNEVWVQAYPGPGRREQVSTNGGTQPVWAQNGRELFYTEPAPDGHVKMMAVPVTTGETFTAGRPQILFEGPYSTTVPVRSYDVTRDANRFLWDRSREASMATPITQVVLVQNWQEELKRLVPTN